MLSDGAKKLRNEYKKKWRLANPEKQKMYNEKYWEKKLKNLQNKDENSTTEGGVSNDSFIG